MILAVENNFSQLDFIGPLMVLEDELKLIGVYEHPGVSDRVPPLLMKVWLKVVEANEFTVLVSVADMDIVRVPVWAVIGRLEADADHVDFLLQVDQDP